MKIKKEVIVVNQKIKSILPMLYTIRTLRAFGMFSFYSMIITSAILLSPKLAIIILGATICGTLFMNVDHSFRIKKIKRLNVQLTKKALKR